MISLRNFQFMTAISGQEIRKILVTLSEVSRDLERHTQLPQTDIEIRERLDELSVEQASLMNSLVELHPKPEARAQFQNLSEELDGLRADIQDCNDEEELANIEAEIEETVNAWVHQFQIIISELEFEATS